MPWTHCMTFKVVHRWIVHTTQLYVSLYLSYLISFWCLRGISELYASSRIFEQFTHSIRCWFASDLELLSPSGKSGLKSYSVNSALVFITAEGFKTPCCIQYENVGWQLLAENSTVVHLFTKHFLANFLGISHVFLTIDHFHTALSPKTIWSWKIIMLVLRLGNCLLNTLLHTGGTICRSL